jgi:hypothetical protein
MEADTDRDGKISFEEFTKMVENTDISMSMTLGTIPSNLIRKPYTLRGLIRCLILGSLSWQVLTAVQINSSLIPPRDAPFQHFQRRIFAGKDNEARIIDDVN